MTDEALAPTPLPKRLSDPEELLYRQVSPVHVKSDSTISAESFRPSNRDAGHLSTLRGHVGADEAFRRWTEDLGSKSIGSFGVSVGEVDAVEVTVDSATLGLQALDDADTVGVEDHASVDFNSLRTRGQQRQAARRLLEAAITRGGALNGDGSCGSST